MVQSRLSGSGGPRSVMGALGALKSNQRASVLLNRMGVLTGNLEPNRPLLERLCAQDTAWNALTCNALEAGLFSEPGLQYRNLAEAIDSLGLETVTLAARAINLFLLLKELSTKSHLPSKDIFKHAVASAVGASFFAGKKDLNVSQASAAGLLHTIGLPVAAYAFPSDYELVRSIVQSDRCSLESAEKNCLGFNFREMGKVALSQFGFIPQIVDAAYSHGQSLSEQDGISMCVSLASTISLQLGCSLGFESAPPDFNEASLSSSGFDDILIEKVVTAIGEAVARFNLYRFD